MLANLTAQRAELITFTKVFARGCQYVYRIRLRCVLDIGLRRVVISLISVRL